MSDNTNGRSQILEIAWQRFAELDANANEAQKWHLTLRLWFIILSVTATLLAIVTQLVVTAYTEEATVARVLNFILISVPIIGSVVLAFANKLRSGERWLALRAGAEEIKRDIFFYRTAWSKESDRDSKLKQQIKSVQLRVFESVEGNLVLKPYKGPIPPEGQEVAFWAALIHLHLLWPKIKKLFSQKKENPSPELFKDNGFDELSAAEYLSCRLEDQLGFHAGKMVGFERNRYVLLALIFVFGGAGTILAAVGLNIWVALTASLAAAFTAWLELRRYEEVAKNYSKVVLELTSIRDDWLLLDQQQQQTDARFFKLVEDTEEVLWSQHQQFIATMREALVKLQVKEAAMAAQEAAEDAAPETQTTPEKTPEAASAAVAGQASEPAVTVAAADSAGQAKKEVSEKIDEAESEAPPPVGPELKPRKGAPHAFVVMPFGQKKGLDGQLIDFNSIYQELIKPALIQAGFEPFRADEETVSGDILTDMFQELLLADLVIADMSIDNANAFYELGVRHALRKRGVVHIQSGRAYMPFDVFNVRTIPYHTGLDGKPDPIYLKQDIEAIVTVTRGTWASSPEAIHSPIFNLLNGLNEPERKTLQTPLAVGYWREHRDWEQRIEVAQRKKRVGDILLLAEEVTNSMVVEEAIAQTGKALADLGYSDLALEQYERGLDINARNYVFRREAAFHLGRLKQIDEAIVRLERMKEEGVAGPEAISFLGRLYKDLWYNEWRQADEQAKAEAAYEAAELLKRSVNTYLTAYGMNLSHYYSGINALTLALLLDHLVQQKGDKDDLDPELEAIRQRIPSLQGAVQFALDQAAEKESDDFWLFATVADVAVLTNEDANSIARAYRKALALGGRSKSNIGSSLQQLRLLASLGFRPKSVAAGIDVLQAALDKLEPPQESDTHKKKKTDQKPPRAFVFAGHLLDRADRPEPRFPPGMEEVARKAIQEKLKKWRAGSNDVAITPGASCGGDIIFIEECLKLEMNVEVYLPGEIATFINESVDYAGPDWVRRFHKIHRHPDVSFNLQPDRLGPVPKGVNLYERNNRWTLYSAKRVGIEQMELIVLWDGQPGDGPGGTNHMVEEMRRLGGAIEHLNTTKLFVTEQKKEITNLE